MDIDCNFVVRNFSEIEFVVCQVFIISEKDCVILVKLAENTLYKASYTFFYDSLRFRVQTIQISVYDYDLSEVECTY